MSGHEQDTGNCCITTEFSDLARRTHNPLGTCRGARPCLGRNSGEACNLPSRLLIRTAANAYFPQVVSILSLAARGTAVHAVKELWDDLQIVDSREDLEFLKKKP